MAHHTQAECEALGKVWNSANSCCVGYDGCVAPTPPPRPRPRPRPGYPHHPYPRPGYPRYPYPRYPPPRPYYPIPRPRPRPVHPICHRLAPYMRNPRAVMMIRRHLAARGIYCPGLGLGGGYGGGYSRSYYVGGCSCSR